MTRPIPIKNLYYLLCYAWDILDERDDALVAQLEGISPVELLAKVLTVSVQRLWKRGLDRGYRAEVDDLRSPRGRIDVPRMVALRLEDQGRVACRFDELSHDILHNQLLATTLRRLVALDGLALTIRADLVACTRLMREVASIPIRAATFAQVQLHGRLAGYRLPLHVCALVHDQLHIDESTGQTRFRDYVEDEKRMARLFEEFVRNFYRRELSGWTVRRDNIDWDLAPLSPDAGQYLPKMETDISLRGHGRTVIIDTKFYKEAFASRFGADKLRSAHLYQLTAYLRSLESRGGSDADAAGVLLYPEVRPIPTLRYGYKRHRVTARGIDLSQDWTIIHERLLTVVAEA